MAWTGVIGCDQGGAGHEGGIDIQGDLVQDLGMGRVQFGLGLFSRAGAHDQR